MQFVTKDAAGTTRFNNSPKNEKDEFYKITTAYKTYKWIASTNKKGFGSSAEFRFQCAKYVAKYYIDDIKIEKIEGIEDGGFEEDDLLYGYTSTITTTSGAAATLTLDKSAPKSGVNALKAAVTAKSDTVSHVNVSTNTRFYPEFGKKYVFSFYAKSLGTNDSIFANINYYNGNNDFRLSQPKGFKLTGQYQKYNIEFSLPADSLFSTKFRFDFGKQVSTIWVDDISVIQGSVTSAAELGETTFTCYPNPADKQLNITGIHSGAVIEMFNIQGIQMKKIIADNSFITVNIQDLNKGIYLLRVGNETRKILIN
jgi:hypothetical protein